MNWLLLAACAAVCMALYNLLIKASAGQVHEMVGAVVLQVVAALVGAGLLLVLYLRGALPPVLATPAASRWQRWPAWALAWPRF
ncbi:hypothetical protein [Hymenobacter sp. APR13]|uniref:hypothetical protein n=1 Tax=Hymenobacter sp. APR13 TaxID=1356852 RepID=UPI0004E06E4D|nr:hypothetical protein [Hymenobacter sp. APR13]AII53792.1 hypothetical protein N008_17645 [Hymenobacter sp. APR13]